jgi:hypothetical protein
MGISRTRDGKLQVTNEPLDFQRRLKEISKFFEGRDQVHKTLRRVVKRLEKAGIPYAVVGGMAVIAHRYVRTTGDVDILLTADGFAEFKRLLVPKHYELQPGRKRRFKDRTNGVTIDILVTGSFPGSGKPGPIAFPDPMLASEVVRDVRVLRLTTLVELKLAAHRHRDFGDVVELIRFNNLDEAFADRLHPSLRRDYLECLEEKRREEEYEAREG